MGKKDRESEVKRDKDVSSMYDSRTGTVLGQPP